MKIKLKDNIFIEGFVTQTGIDLELISDNKSFLRDVIFDEFNSNLIYEGKTSKIPESIAKECVIVNGNNTFYDYSKAFNGIRDIVHVYKNTAKESIQSACNQPYCIIYKQE